MIWSVTLPVVRTNYPTALSSGNSCCIFFEVFPLYCNNLLMLWYGGTDTHIFTWFVWDYFSSNYLSIISLTSFLDKFPRSSTCIQKSANANNIVLPILWGIHRILCAFFKYCVISHHMLKKRTVCVGFCHQIWNNRWRWFAQSF